MCLLTGKQILEKGIILDAHLDVDAEQPASVDLRLGEFLMKPGIGIALLFQDYILKPGEFILAHTRETVRIPRRYAARVEGKSTLGRKGLIIHATAGFIDPGFEGQVTLEMSNISNLPIPLRAGMYIAQICVMKMDKKARPYNGKYQYSVGVVSAQ